VRNVLPSYAVALAYDGGVQAVRTKVTSNGQISLPAELRHRWRTPAVLVIDKGDYAIVRPVPDDPVAALRGSHSGPGPASEQARALDRATSATHDDTRTT
jgi:bifunctional DNA-binding transcriptional regulator/antitoxin component of YhaV-PrlF toxin-antitoxin module